MSVHQSHVYLTDPSLLSSCSTSPPLGNSDHRSIMLSLNRLKCPPPSIHRRIWNYSRADWDSICADLENLPTPTEDVDSSWAAWKSQFLTVLSSHIPTKVCKVRKSLPWITSDLLKLFVNVTWLSPNSRVQIRKDYGQSTRYSGINPSVLCGRPSVNFSRAYLHLLSLPGSSGLYTIHYHQTNRESLPY